MRGILFWGIFLLTLLPLRAQVFSVFPQEEKIIALEENLLNDSNTLFYRFGALNGSYFEESQGGNNSHLWALKFASEQRFLDSTPLVPMVIADFVSNTDTFKHVVWFAAESDTALLKPYWVDMLTARGSYWSAIAWEERWQRMDSFAYFVLRDYLLPLPCHHESIYLNYLGEEDIELSIDNDYACGLNFEECYGFIYEHAAHLRAFHEASCGKNPMLTLEVGVRNAPIHDIRAFIQIMSRIGVKVDLVFPWEP